MKHFIFICALLCVVGMHTAKTADFFIPQSEQAPRYEKLPTLNRAYQEQNMPTKQHEYIYVDGRFLRTDADEEPQIPPQAPEVVQAEPIQNQPAPVLEQPAPQIAQTPVKTVQSVEPDAIKQYRTAQNTTEIESIYQTYLQTLSDFQQTGTLSANPRLENALRKMNSAEKIVIFQGKV